MSHVHEYEHFDECRRGRQLATAQTKNLGLSVSLDACRVELIRMPYIDSQFTKQERR